MRLVNGNSSAGRLEVFHNGIWGTVCDDDFGMDEAEVVCRQLGFRSAVKYYCCAHFGYGSGSILLDDVNCRGNESYIGQCYHRSWGSHNCGHREDVSVACSNNGMNIYYIFVVYQVVTVYYLEYLRTLCDIISTNI